MDNSDIWYVLDPLLGPLVDVDPISQFGADFLRIAHLFVTWGIFWAAVLGAYLAWKRPPAIVKPVMATLGYLIIIFLIGPVATARFLNTIDVIPWLENEGALVLLTGHLIAMAYTWVLVALTIRRYRRTP